MEIALAYLDNLHYFFGFVGFLLLIGWVIVSILLMVIPKNEIEKEDWLNLTRAKRVTFLPMIFFILFSNIPSMSDLWKVRIGLIKYELASQDNIKNTIDTIERIGKKLECKYLGCEEEKKK